MDCFTRLEALIDAGSVINSIRNSSAASKAAREPVARCLSRARASSAASALAFLMEAGLEAFHNPARRLARLRLSRLKLLLPLMHQAFPN